MADVTGALHHKFGESTYCLRLTLGGIAKLQGKHGNDLGGLLSGKFDAVEGQPAPIPPFDIMIDMIATALIKGEKMSEAEALDLADDMLTADQALAGRLMEAAFPGQVKEGNGQAPKRKARA